MLVVFAEFETNLWRERHMEGIADAKARGVYRGKGRRRSTDSDEVRRMAQEERMRPTEIARKLGISRTSVYRQLSLAPADDGPVREAPDSVDA